MELEKIKRDILELYDLCIENTASFHTKIDICIVPDYLAQLVFDATNVAIDNHWISIDNYGIIHTLQQYSNPISEAKRGQIAIERADFIHFIEVVLEPDVIKLLPNTKRTNLPQLQFEKTINNKKIVVKEIRTVKSPKKNKVSRIMFQTMYKFKKPN